MKFTGKNVQVSPKAQLGRNVRIGDNTVIYDHVVIGDDCVIANDCVIGEPTSAYYSDLSYVNAKTFIGSGALIRSHSIIYAGCSIGERFSSGHRITLRENTMIGNDCKVGTACDLQGFLSMGDHCQLHSNVHLCQFSRLADFVFIYPNVVLGNDRHPPSEMVQGPSIGSFTQIGIQSSIIGDIKIGEHCLIGANSLVLNDFQDHSLILGAPATRRSDVRELLAEDGKQLYPWSERFGRGMPWKTFE